MNRLQWESRLAELQRKRKQAWKEVNRLDSEIADCFVHIEGIRQREAMAHRKQARPRNNKRGL